MFSFWVLSRSPATSCLERKTSFCKILPGIPKWVWLLRELSLLPDFLSFILALPITSYVSLCKFLNLSVCDSSFASGSWRQQHFCAGVVRGMDRNSQRKVRVPGTYKTLLWVCSDLYLIRSKVCGVAAVLISETVWLHVFILYSRTVAAIFRLLLCWLWDGSCYLAALRSI